MSRVIDIIGNSEMAKNEPQRRKDHQEFKGKDKKTLRTLRLCGEIFLSLA